MRYLFTSESVSEGHPDKVADQISDAILDAMLTQDPNSRVACETLVTTGLVVLAGEVTSNATVDVQEVARQTIEKIGYTKSEYMFDARSCGIISTIHEQSPDIAQGVDEKENKEQGAGDQGMMFGYANSETPEFMPMALAYAHRLVRELARIRKETDLMPYLRPDAKSQVTIEYTPDGKPARIDTIVISTQHDDFDKDEKRMQAAIHEHVKTILIPHVIPANMIDNNTIIHVNPTGKFVIGGPHGDTGLTGRKIIVDTYGGKGAHGGGAFSGKDPSKVDRSAAYAARHIAKNVVAAGIADECLIQVAYAIGIAKPVSLFVNTYGTSKLKITDAQIAATLNEVFDMRPRAIVERLGLKNPIFLPTAAYGHMGRESYVSNVLLSPVQKNEYAGTVTQVRTPENKQVKFFTWEALDFVDTLRDIFKV
jgi:S-adenosylmethionine synthetase